jgi:restriction endonuclease Mrr
LIGRVAWPANSFEKRTLLVLVTGFRIAVSAVRTYHSMAETPSAKNRRQGLLVVARYISSSREDLMHAVVRNYSGTGAKELFDLLEARKGEVESLIRSVTGFVAYSLIRTGDGGISVTVCQDKAGTDESLQLAKNWIQENAVDLDTSAPSVSEGSVIVQLS